MVERCEELRHSPDLGFLQKMTMSATIRLLISRSIKLELRTKQDWDAHREAMRLAMHKLPIKCKFVTREGGLFEG